MKNESLWFLRKKCAEVSVIDSGIVDKFKKMLNFMYENGGIGLAANQIKIFERLVVIDLQKNNKKCPIFLVNPQIIEKSEELVDSHESCISIQNVGANVKRYKNITVKYLDKDAKENSLKADGLLSICLQHEIDLLDGITFLDRIEDRTDDIQRVIDKIDGDGMNKLRVKSIVKDVDFLRNKSEPVEKIDDELIGTMREMVQLMYDSNGIGLAGVQVGILKRILVIDLGKNDEKKPIFVINPEIIKHSDKIIDSEEGCLSVPGERETIKRYETIKVKYTNEKKEKVTLDADGLLAVCFQHEIDHLNGIMFIDHLSKLKRDFLVKKVLKNYKNNR
jgi:peptide deformylase